MRLAYEKGTLRVETETGASVSVPHTMWDDRTGTDRALGLHYCDIITHLRECDTSFEDSVLDLVPTPELTATIELRPYQQDALERWAADNRGTLVLPTGAGMTYVGMAAIEAVDAPTFVVVPTLDLVDQWIDELAVYHVDIGVTREPTILRTGRRVMIPDFRFERDEAAFYLEVVGFWTPDYLAEKLEKVRQVESEHPIVLAVNEALSCTEADFDGANVDEVSFYRDRIPVKPVIKRINEIDRRRTEAEVQELRRDEASIADDRVVAVAALAAEYGVSPEVMVAYLESECSGGLSNGRYVPPPVLAELKSEIEQVDGDTLADVNRILAAYGVAQEILEEIGYEISYVSLAQEEAEIRPID